VSKRLHQLLFTEKWIAVKGELIEKGQRSIQEVYQKTEAG